MTDKPRTSKGHLRDCALFRKGGSLTCDCGKDSRESLPSGDYAGLVERLREEAEHLHNIDEGWGVADNICASAHEAANAIKALVQERDALDADRNAWRAQCFGEKERAERAEIGLNAEQIHSQAMREQLTKAESDLAECMTHADAMEARLRMENFLYEVSHYRTWRAKQ